MKYIVIEMWENSQPALVVEPATNEVFTTDSLEEAIEEAKDCQDGYILDFSKMLIYNADAFAETIPAVGE